MPRQKQEGYRFKRGSQFYLQLNINGTRTNRLIVNRDTGKPCTSKEEADTWRNTTAAEVRKEIAGRITEKVPVSDLEKVYRKYLPNYSKRHGKTHVDADKKLHLPPSTLRFNLSTINQFTQFLELEKVKTLDQITKEHAEGFTQTKGSLKASTFNRYLMALKHICWIVPQIDKNLFDNVVLRSTTRVQEETASRERFEDEQLLIMQEKATGWIRAAMFLAFHTGLRLGDVVCLKSEEICSAGFIDHCNRKTGKRQKVYAPEVLSYLEQWQRQRVLDWNRRSLFNSRTLASTLGISAGGTVQKVLREISHGWPESEREYQTRIKAGVQMAIKNGARAEALQAFIDKGATVELDPIPAKLQGYVFPRQASSYLGINRSRDESACCKEFQSFLRDTCGFNTCDADGNQVLGFHSLRVSKATRHILNGGTIESASKQLNHSSTRVTEGYDRRNDAEIEVELMRTHAPLAFPGTKQEAVCKPDRQPADLAVMLSTLSAEQLEQVSAMIEATKQSRS